MSYWPQCGIWCCGCWAPAGCQAGFLWVFIPDKGLGPEPYVREKPAVLPWGLSFYRDLHGWGTMGGGWCPSGPDCNEEKPLKPRINQKCKQCGSIITYATELLAEKISQKYDLMASFLTSSKLKVNDDKTHTMLLSTSQMRRSRDLGMVVAIGSELSQPSEVEKLLGVQVHQNMKWGNMIMNNKKSLIQALTTRSNALAIICRLANFKTQKM